MAISNSDGSIILSTKVDTSGIDGFFKKYNGKFATAEKAVKKNTKAVQVFNETTKESIDMNKLFGEKSEESTKKAKKGFEDLRSSVKGVATAIASAFAIQKIIQFSNESAKLATQTEASVQRLVDIYGSASKSVANFIDENARALGMSKAAAASFSSVYGNLFSVWADQATNAELTNRYLQMTAVVASKTGRTVEDVQERVRSGLLGNTEAIEDLGIFVNVKTIEMTDAFKRMANGRSWEQLDAYTQQQVRSMAILEQATEKYGKQVAETSATTRAKFKAAYEDFKQSWGEIVNKVLLPVLEVLTAIFDITVRGIEALTGKSSNITDKIEEGTGNISGNIDESNKNQEDFNESLEEAEKTSKKLLANFDDLYILTSQDEGSNIIDNIENKLEISDDWGEVGTGETVDKVENDMTELAGKIGEWLVAIGLILLFTGGIGWGVGFIAAGAGLYSVTEATLSDGGIDGEKIKKEMSDLVGAIGKLMLAVGAVLVVMTGFNKYSLTALAFGALSWVLIQEGGEKIEISEWDIGSIKSAINDAIQITADILLIIGMILVVKTGFNKRSLSALAYGAKLKREDSEFAEETEDPSALSKFKDDINDLIRWSSGAFVVIGLMLCAGGYWKMGLKFLAAGGTALFFSSDDGEDEDKAFKETIQALPKETQEKIAEDILEKSGFGEGYRTGELKQIMPAARSYIKQELARAGLDHYVDKLYPVSSLQTPSIGIQIAEEARRQYYYDLVFGARKQVIDSIIESAKSAAKIPYSVTDTTDDPMSPTNATSDTSGILTTTAQNATGKTEIVLEIDGREFGRAVVEQGNRESQRIGTRLVVV